jgi:hypothetical protein
MSQKSDRRFQYTIRILIKLGEGFNPMTEGAERHVGPTRLASQTGGVC